MPSPTAWCTRVSSDGAGADALDQVDLPQRAAVVERRGREVADERAQRLAVVRRRQRDPVEVVVGVEVRVVLPVRRR